MIKTVALICGTLVSLTLITDAFEQAYDSATEETESERQEPCNDNQSEGDKDDNTKQCSLDNPQHVLYWTSRRDTAGIACRADPYSCDHRFERFGMTAHCHGFGRNKFCHIHPGGLEEHVHFGKFTE